MKKIVALHALLMCATVYGLITDNEHLIPSMYQDINGFGASVQDRAKVAEAGGDPTYGEITYQGAQGLINYIKPGLNDVFYDLGCGVGKFVVQVYLNTPVKKSCGIELSHERVVGAHKALMLLRTQKKLQPGRELVFLEQDFVSADFSDATIIFICSTCFSQELM